MLYFVGMHLAQSCSLAHVIHYISFRAIMGLLTTFVLSVALGHRFIALSGRIFQNSARPFTPQSHQEKGSTPTMGGLFMLGMVFLNMLLWCDLSKPEVWILALCMLLFGAIGFLDDVFKVLYKKGISARLKFRLQLICSLVVALSWIWLKAPSWVIYAPILKGFVLPVGYLLIPWIMFVVIGTSNAVNLTDGLDGLATGALLINFVFFSGVAYMASHAEFASYLHIPYTGCSEAVIVGAILIGAMLGFLWFNAYPAEIFMGDVGSLPLGAVLAMLALVSRQELLLPIAGGLFVMEALSVIIQVASVKILGRRMFKMAPLHHHFEMIGWKESKVTIRFHIVTLILCLCAAICLKVR